MATSMCFQVSWVGFTAGRFNRFSSFRLLLCCFLHFPVSHTKVSFISPRSIPAPPLLTGLDGWRQPYECLCREERSFWHGFGWRGRPCLSAVADVAPSIVLHTRRRKETTSPGAVAHTADSHRAGEPARREPFRESRS